MIIKIIHKVQKKSTNVNRHVHVKQMMKLSLKNMHTHTQSHILHSSYKIRDFTYTKFETLSRNIHCILQEKSNPLFNVR